jgi:activator of HSP90 ATPase
MKEFKKYITLHASPEDVYNALVNPVMLELWTGEPAIMAEEPGTDFSLWDGSISGKNIEFEKNSMIRQEWNFGEQEEPSMVTFRLHRSGKNTSLEIRHINIPDDYYENMREGWLTDFIGGLEQLFEE